MGRRMSDLSSPPLRSILHIFTLFYFGMVLFQLFALLTRFDFIAVSSKSSRVWESGYMYQPVARRDERRTYW